MTVIAEFDAGISEATMHALADEILKYRRAVRLLAKAVGWADVGAPFALIAPGPRWHPKRTIDGAACGAGCRGRPILRPRWLGATPQDFLTASLREQAEPPFTRSRLLRTYRERPCCRAAEQRDELASLHSITSSVRASSVAGMSRPSVFAVLRLTTSSYLVGACTGKSATLSPFRMRST